MLHINTLALGSYQTNCYILWAEGSKACAVIDPGEEPERVLAKLSSLGLTLEAILLTHGHFDHVGAVEALQKATGCALWMHEEDYRLSAGWLYPLAGRELPRLQFCKEGDTIEVGGLSFRVLHTPGHTPGSVCYSTEDALFCGDTLFAGSCGRIDLPGGDRIAMLDSLERLAEMKGDCRIFSGHGGSSSLSREQAANPYLQGLL